MGKASTGSKNSKKNNKPVKSTKPTKPTKSAKSAKSKPVKSKPVKPTKYSKHKESDSEVDNNEVTDIDDIDDIEDGEYNSGSEIEMVEEPIEDVQKNIDKKTSERLKAKINEWLDYDDKIKEYNAKSKKYKDAKKQQEELIMKMINKLEIDDMKIDVCDSKGNNRSRVYRQKSVTKEPIKELTIRSALMESLQNEKRVDQLLKKIESKRPIKERYYLKRTKGNSTD